MSVITNTSTLDQVIKDISAHGPAVVKDVKRVSLLRIGEFDIKTLRATGLRKLRIRSTGPQNAFKYHLSDENTLSEYSKWPGAKSLKDGGTHRSRGPMQLVFTQAFYDLTGKEGDEKRRRIYNRGKVKKLIADGKAMWVERPGRPTLLVHVIGGVNKKGNARKNSRWVILAIVMRSTRHKGGWYDIEGNSRNNAPIHDQIIRRTLDEFVDRSPLVDKQ